MATPIPRSARGPRAKGMVTVEAGDDDRILPRVRAVRTVFDASRLDALGPAPRAELLHVLTLPDFNRADRIGDFYGTPKTRTFAELLIDAGEDPCRSCLGRDAKAPREVGGVAQKGDFISAGAVDSRLCDRW